MPVQRFSIIGALAIFLTALFCIFLLPSIIVGLQGGFAWHNLVSERALEGGQQLVISQRTSFPATEWLDPATILRVELLDQTGHRLALQRVNLIEASDFATPQIEWNTGEVRITGFDRRQNQSVSLARPRATQASRN